MNRVGAAVVHICHAVAPLSRDETSTATLSAMFRVVLALAEQP